MFKPVKSKVHYPALEEEALHLWDKLDAFKKSIEQRDPKNTFFFYDGPPFATGLPHYGHLLASTIKDVVPRYQTMLGKRVERRFGWDCHGLPVEFEVEKELGLKGKKDIEAYGIDQFNEKCRSIVLRYASEWKRTIRRMGRWVDMENDYKTMDLPFMESIWWVFKELYTKGLIYESKKIVAYSPRLGTPLSNFEVNLGYQDTQDPAITIKFKLKGEENTYFLAWTTTPWTLPSNLGLTVNPAHDYVCIEFEETRYILAQALIQATLPKEAEYQTLWIKKGSELSGLEYKPLFPYFQTAQAEGAFRVLLGDYVTLDAGTGIVHTAPSFGEDDFVTGQTYNLPHVFPIDDNGFFTSEAPDYEGQFFKDADKPIIKDLKAQGLIFRHETLTHSYPFCWRSGVPLMYRTIGSWFLDVEKIKAVMLENNNQIHWKPGHIQAGRMGKWLEGARAWAISRNRYWGNPIPVWVCGCGARHCVGSQAELEALTGQRVTDLHSHFIDQLTIKCPQCGEAMHRTPEVLDCWFESGSMPYGQAHYPFENKETFDGAYPADFISEGIDQTRGWFYTLLVLSTALFEKPAFKNCIVSGMLLAEDGKKMSKSLKNYPDPWEMLNQYGADVVRLYMLNSGAIKADELKFSEAGLKETLRNNVIPLWNVLSFFTTYANADGYQGRLLVNAEGLSNPLDRWIWSRLNHLIVEVREAMDDYDLNRSVAPFVGFIDLLTNWYVRRSRRRFWKSENEADKLQAYDTLYTVLHQLSMVIAPFVPFLAESIFQVLRKENEPQSVHLCDYPKPNPAVIDPELEKEMEIVLGSVNLGRGLRAKHQLKVRQPLASITLVTKNQAVLGVLERMQDLITDELNVKQVKIAQNEEALVELIAKPNLKLLGPKLGKKLGLFREAVARLSTHQIVELQEGGRLTLDLGGEPFDLGIDDLFLERQQKEGIFTQSEGELTVALDAHLTPELEQEGLARELINRIQQHRKEMDLEVTDRIQVNLEGSPTLMAAVSQYQDYIMAETLALTLAPGPTDVQTDLGSEVCGFRVVKA